MHNPLGTDITNAIPVFAFICPVILCVARSVGFRSACIIPSAFLRQAFAVSADRTLTRALGLLPPVDMCQ